MFLFLRLVVTGGILLMLPSLGLHADDWKPGPGHRFAEARPAAAGHTGFRLMPDRETGLKFTNVLDQARSLTNQIYLNGTGGRPGGCRRRRPL